MKFVQVASSIYFSSSVLSSFLCPSLFVPLTVSYVLGVGGYEFLNYSERRQSR